MRKFLCSFQASFVFFKRVSFLSSEIRSFMRVPFLHVNFVTSIAGRSATLVCFFSRAWSRSSACVIRSNNIIREKPKPQLRNTFSSESVKRETCSRSHAHTPCDAAL